MDDEHARVQALLTRSADSRDFDAVEVAREGVRRGQARRRHRVRLRVGALVTAVMVIGIGAVVIGHGSTGRLAPAASVDVGEPGPEPVPPPGTRYVGMGDVVVAVPIGWVTEQPLCSRPGPSDVYFEPLPQAECPQVAKPGTRASSLGIVSTDRPAAREALGEAHSPRTVGGLPILTGERLSDCVVAPECDPRIYVVIPSARVAMTLISPRYPDRTVDDIVASVRILPTGWTTVPSIAPGTEYADAERTLMGVGLTGAVLENGVLTPGELVRAVHPEAAGSVVRLGSRVQFIPTSGRPAPRHRQHAAPPPTSCLTWSSRGTIRHDIQSRYGDILDCSAFPGAWVLTTEPSPHGPGLIGVAPCSGSCTSDPPNRIGDWTFVGYSHDPSSGNRIAGLDPHGSVIFTGASGEASYDPRTGRFSKPPLFEVAGAG